MKKYKNLFSLLTIALFLFFTQISFCQESHYIPPIQAPTQLSSAAADDNLFLGRPYFNANNVEGAGLTWILNPPLETYMDNDEKLKNKKSIDTHLLYWGSTPNDYKNGIPRYFGYNYSGEYISNPLLDDDSSLIGTLESKDWISFPWERTYIADWLLKRNEPQIYVNYPYDNDPKFRPNIVKGLQLARQEKFLNNTQTPWEQYVHILQPPTNFGWGIGRMWHRSENNGGIYYISVPLVPRCVFDTATPNLYIKNIDPGIAPKQDAVGNYVYEAQVGRKYAATITYGIGRLSDRRVNLDEIEPFIAGMHQVNGQAYPGTLIKRSGNGQINPKISQYPFKIGNHQAHTINFNAQGTEIIATFEWTPQMGTEKLIAAINDGHYVAQRHEFEIETKTEKGDNTKEVPIKVIPPPDLYVAKLDPGTKYKEQGEAYDGKVSFGLKPGYKEKVTARITLQHNGYDVPGVHGQTVTFDPSNPASLVKEFDFQFTGMPDHVNSELYAKITPVEPTSVDLNPSDNDKKVIVKSQNIDIAVTDIVQTVPVYTKTIESAYAVFKNSGDNAETFTAKFYVDGRSVKTTKVTVPAKREVKKYFQWKTPDTPKTVAIKVEADPEEKLREKNRANNTRVENFAVVNPPVAPLYCQDSDSAVWSYDWTEQYQRVVENEDGEEETEYAYVDYSEEISTDVIIYTKQGPPDLNNFPTPPEPRESRGRWEIEDWAADNGLNPNEVTRAGYGFEVKVITTYKTNYENPPAGFGNNNRPIIDLSTLRVEFFDTRGRSVVDTADHTIHLECTDTSKYTLEGINYTVKTWELPLNTITFSDGRSPVEERKHYVDLKTPDGEYELVLSSLGPIGINDQLKVCDDNSFVTIHGNMYDDIYTRPKV